MADLNSSKQTDFQFFYEDEVYKINKRGQVVFGLVTENFQGNSSSDESETEGGHRGEVQVVWHPLGAESHISPSVGLADRSLMPGDVVRRMIKGKDTQRGYCRDITVTAAVQVVGTNLVLPAVPSERLQPLEEFTTDLAVCLDSWVGTTKIVHSKMRLITSDGSRVEFPDINSCLLEDYIQRRRRSSRMPLVSTYIGAPDFYPGQILTGQMCMLDEANWLHCTKEMKAARKHRMREQKFTVESVETESVGVQWQCRALGSGPPGQPRFLVDGEDLKRLKLLNLFEPYTLQLGARNFLAVNDRDIFITKGQWKKTQSKVYRSLRRQTRPPKNRESKENHSKDGNPQQETTPSNKVTFRVSCKSKRRLSYNRENRPTFTTLHSSQAQSNQLEKTQVARSCAGEDSQSHMDVDIVIVNGGIGSQKTLGENSTESGTANNDTSIPIVSIQSDHLQRLDIPDTTLNGKITPEESSTPSGTPERHRKLRKSRKCLSSTGSSDSLPAINGDQKVQKTPNDVDSDNWDSSDDVTNSDSCATWSSHCSSSPNNSWRGKRLPQLVTKFLKGKRLKRSAHREPTVAKPHPGDRIVVETLMTTSKANVVWQDGTIEMGIASTELYPIHHLDGQECFPGDFVISGSGSPSMRDYGVVQKVDHHGRTAVVKWFRTYTSSQEPVPQLVSESEVSVYDLKDHPDFQYRPGTVVIRVANFTGSEINCTAGQVMDNYPSGRVNVWWVDGHTSMCWPQDLFKVGEYDSDEGELWAEDGTGSEDSWETQYSGGSGHRESRERDLLSDRDIEGLASGEACKLDGIMVSDFPKVPGCLEPRAAAHIERGRAAMAKLEEMFSKNPSLQNQEIMRKLLNLYKDCRFLDRLLGTSFFHEDHFQGLLERVRERGSNRDTLGPAGTLGTRRVHNQVMRLFSNDESDQPSSEIGIQTDTALFDHNTKLSIQSVSNTKSTRKSLPQSEMKNLGLVGDHFQKVLCSIQVVNCCDDIKHVVSNSDLSKCPNESNIDFESMKDICKHLIKSDGGISKDGVQGSNLNSSFSEGSLCKYLTPTGSGSDLAARDYCETSAACSSVNRAGNCEDSGIESQSVSMSHSANNTESCNGDLDSRPNELTATESQLKVSMSSQPQAHSSPETLLSTRNVCQKLCSLINVQMMKACAEISRRRRLVLADFLNNVLSKMSQNSSEAPLPYRFSEQYDSLVVTMVDEKENDYKKDIKTEEPTVAHAENEIAESADTVKADTVIKSDGIEGNELGEGFNILECAPITHHFRLSVLQPSDRRLFQQAMRRELKLLQSDLPQGIWVRGYEDRMDLFSIMIAGPAKTPYEDGLFLFDVHLGGEFPRAPPMCHYISYCSDRLNPNLYEDGKVCVSLLGTWSGKGVEVWGKDSSLLQVIISMQGLILCAEPYFNEAGYDKQKGSQQGMENSRMYNEMVLLKLVQSLTKQLGNPPPVFKKEIFSFQSHHAAGLCKRLEAWMKMSDDYVRLNPQGALTSDSFHAAMGSSLEMVAPDYPLLPVSRGFCLTLGSSLDAYKSALRQTDIDVDKNL